MGFREVPAVFSKQARFGENRSQGGRYGIGFLFCHRQVFLLSKQPGKYRPDQQKLCKGAGHFLYRFFALFLLSLYRALYGSWR